MPLKNDKIPRFIKPMLATTIDKPFDSEEWLFELKLDGYRAIAEISSRKLLLYSRNGLDLSVRYPSLVKELKKNKAKIIVDGEIVASDERGKPDFQLLQNYLAGKKATLAYYVFDILSLNNKDLTVLPLLERKKILKRELRKSRVIIYCDHVENEGREFFSVVKNRDLEGIMAKRKDSLYYPGTRTKNWLKIKYHQSQEAVIIGFTKPKGSRKHFGSILLAEYRKKQLHYIGHAGTGFSDRMLDELMKKMKPLISAQPPLREKIRTNGSVTWLKPLLVAEISFSEITRDGILRHPVFKGLREDKEAKKVKRATEKILPVNKVIHS